MGGEAKNIFGNVKFCKNKNNLRKYLEEIAHSGGFLVF